MTAFEIAELGRFIKKNAIAGHDPHFVIKEEGNEIDQPEEVYLDTSVLNRMINQQAFRMNGVDIRRPTKFSRTEISLCLTRDASYPISGFPRRLHDGKPSIQGTRPCSVIVIAAD